MAGDRLDYWQWNDTGASRGLTEIRKTTYCGVRKHDCEEVPLGGWISLAQFDDCVPQVLDPLLVKIRPLRKRFQTFFDRVALMVGHE